MKGATHFIEVYRSNQYIINGSITPIDKLQQFLKNTSSSNVIYTVAIWKIKPKNTMGKSCNTSEITVTTPVLDLTPAEPVYCTAFGCGKILTLPESLAGNKCMQHCNDDLPATVGGGYNQEEAERWD